MSDDNVTALPGAAGLPENPLQVAPRPLHWCSHPAVIIDEHTRSIRCADVKCGAVLDAFDYLRANAHTIQRAWDSHRQVMRQANEVAERVHHLKKEEQRLRAMVKRLQEKTGAVIAVRGKEGL